MSTIKVNSIVPPNVGEGVTIDGLQMPTAGALSNRNLIINGAMQVAQRGTSSTTVGYATVDRFKLASSGGTKTQSRESLTSGSPYDEGFHNFYRATNTSAGSNNASDFVTFRHVIEDQNLACSGWTYKSSSSFITLSFWVRSSVSQEFYVHFNQGTDAYNYACSIGTLAANTWTKITKTVPGNSNLSFGNDNSAGLEVNIVPFWGTNFTTSGSTVNAWYAWNSASRVPDMTTTWNTTAGATFDMVGVQLEVGSKATPFEHESYGQTLAKCMRYYQTYGNTTNTILVGGYGVTGSSNYFTVYLSTFMRAAPSVTKVGTWYTTLAGQPAVEGILPNSFGMSFPGNGNGNQIVASGVGNYLIAESEL